MSSNQLGESINEVISEAVDMGITNMQLSNLYTMHVASEVDPRQAIPPEICLPSGEVRLLRAKLLLEEVLETIRDLGLQLVHSETNKAIGMSSFQFFPVLTPNLEGILDGCSDLKYVATGTITACGVPEDLVHNQVCLANDSKFVEGKVIVDENGKFLKPEGWKPPDIMGAIELFKTMNPSFNLAAFAEKWKPLAIQLLGEEIGNSPRSEESTPESK